MDQVQSRGTILPILILDTILPRQTLKIEVPDDPLFRSLVSSRIQEEVPFFGMIGMARLAGTGQDLPLQNGCEVEIIGNPVLAETGLRVTLKGRRRFRIEANELNTAPEGWTEAKVIYFDSADEEALEDADMLNRAKTQAKTFLAPNMSGESFVDQWIKLARQNERQTGQIDTLLEDIGDPPSPEEPSELAFWIGALVNPLPGMGGKSKRSYAILFYFGLLTFCAELVNFYSCHGDSAPIAHGKDLRRACTCGAQGNI